MGFFPLFSMPASLMEHGVQGNVFPKLPGYLLLFFFIRVIPGQHSGFERQIQE